MTIISLLLVVFNALLYLFALRRHWRKSRIVDCGFVLIGVYAITAVICVINYCRVPERFNLHLLPFIYLFVVLMIFFKPYLLSTSDIVKKIEFRNANFFVYFSYIYIISGFIVLFFSWRDIYNAITAPDWMDVYSDVFEKGIILYHNQVERIAKNICGYSQILALVLAFYFLSDYNHRPYLALALVLSAIVSMASTTVIAASRGAMAGMMLKLMAGFALFSPIIQKKVKKNIITVGGIILTIFVVYVLSVTFTRFAEVTYDASFDDPITSIFFYFGHSMLFFDDGIADSIQHFMWGDYMFGSNKTLYLQGYDSVLGTHFGTAFFTFVGALYLDFGPVLTLIIAFILSKYLTSEIKKKRIRLSNIYIYYFFLCYYINGVFVVGTGYYLSIIMAFVLYFILKRFDYARD